MVSEKKELNSKNRIITTLQHKEPDKVPLDLGGMGSTGIMAIAYANMRRYWNLPEVPIVLNDIGQQLADIHEDVLKKLNVDVVSMWRLLPPSFESKKNKFKKFPLTDNAGYLKGTDEFFIPQGVKIAELPDGLGILDRNGNVEFRKPHTSYYFDRVYYPLAEATEPSDIDKLPMWKSLDNKFFEKAAQKARYLSENTDYAIMVSAGCQFVESGQTLLGWERFMMELAYDSKLVHHLLNRLLERHINYLDKLLSAIKDYIHIVVVGDDLGTQNAPMLSPDMFRRMIFPYEKKLYSFIHQKFPNIKIFLHSCGSIYRLIPMLIEAGIDILNPVQTSAAEMDPIKLKKEFGKDLVFWGGGVEALTLSNDTPEQIQDMVKERIEIFAPGGGFVFCQVHNLQANFPPRNIAAMYEALEKYR